MMFFHEWSKPSNFCNKQTDQMFLTTLKLAKTPDKKWRDPFRANASVVGSLPSTFALAPNASNKSGRTSISLESLVDKGGDCDVPERDCVG